ncbi:hypothetical protein DY000_02014841 [Brassica cretica]|uniref:Uncharacterized protein n=1 Tax=Brassica cretica TaxID=69181 RepID=A0ABQ7CSJ0_BRACR|nr:hypothetical protein DY000_02014841 [Brassica cretica]
MTVTTHHHCDSSVPTNQISVPSANCITSYKVSTKRQKPKTRPLRKAWKARPLVTGVTKREDGGIGYAPLAINSLSLSLSKALFDERRFDVSFGDSSRRRLLRCLSSAASSPVTLLGDLSLCGPPRRVGALSGCLS